MFNSSREYRPIAGSNFHSTLPSKLMNPPALRMICSRNVAFIDAGSLALCEAKETLFRDENGFLLYFSRKVTAGQAAEHLIRMAVREALVWLNEDSEDRASISIGNTEAFV